MTGKNIDPDIIRLEHGRCWVCRTPLEKNATGRPRKTCGPACRQKLYRQRLRLQQPYNNDYSEREGLKRVRAFLKKHPDASERIVYRIKRKWPVWYCQECKQPFIVDTPGKGKLTRYCSNKCQQKAARARAALRRRGEYATARAGQVVDAQIALRLRAGLPLGVCPICGTYFVPNTQGQPRKYCSDSCRKRAWRKTHRRCRTCGKWFRVQQQHPQKLYCSRSCRSRFNNLRQSELERIEREAERRRKSETWSQERYLEEPSAEWWG